jgi:hypothetical protein
VSALGANAAYAPGTDHIGVNPALTQPQALSSIAHEGQHAIQAREGFAAGGNSRALEGGASQYGNLAGEAEARNVQTRLNMSPQERRDMPPWWTLDRDQEDLIPVGNKPFDPNRQPGQTIPLGERGRAAQMNEQLRAARAAQPPPPPMGSLSQTRNIGDLATLAGNKLSGMAGLGGMMGRGLAGMVGGVMENAINRTPYGALVNGVDQLDFSISGVMKDIDASIAGMMEGMEVTPEMQGVMGDIRGGLEGMGMPPGVIDTYLEGVDPYARKTQDWFTEKGYPRVGEEVGAGMRLGEMFVAP